MDEDLNAMDARGGDCRGEAVARGDPLAPGQQRTRALLASPGALGPSARENGPGADRPYVAGVSSGLPAVPPVLGRAVTSCASLRRAVSRMTARLRSNLG